MAAVKPINGIEPLYIQIGQYGMYLISCILVQSSKRLDPEHPVDLEWDPLSVGQCIILYDYGLVC